MPSHSEVPSIEYLMDRLGDFSERTLLEQGETNEEKEVWIRKRVVTLRALIDNYPTNPWVADCLREYEMWKRCQSPLLAQESDTLDQETYEPSGLYRPSANSLPEGVDIDRARQAGQTVLGQLLQLAAHFLTNHPDSMGVAWAHDVRLGALERRLYQQYVSNPSLIPDTREEMMAEAVGLSAFLSKTQHTAIDNIISESIEKSTSSAVYALLEGVESFKADERSSQLSYLEKLRKLFPNSEGVLNKCAKLESIGQPFELAFEDLLRGEYIDIRQYRGSVVMIVFWATWCQPCLQYVPFLKEFRDEHREFGLEIVGVSADAIQDEEDSSSNEFQGETARHIRAVDQKVRDCAIKHGIDWPVFADEEFHQRWGVTSIPRTFVVDRQGKLSCIAQDASAWEHASELCRTARLDRSSI